MWVYYFLAAGLIIFLVDLTNILTQVIAVNIFLLSNVRKYDCQKYHVYDGTLVGRSHIV